MVGWEYKLWDVRKIKICVSVGIKSDPLLLLGRKMMCLGYGLLVQGDSLARGPKLLSIRNYVNQLTDDELTTGYYHQDGATCHTSNASMREIESFFFKTELSQKKTFGHPDLPI